MQQQQQQQQRLIFETEYERTNSCVVFAVEFLFYIFSAAVAAKQQHGHVQPQIFELLLSLQLLLLLMLPMISLLLLYQ